MTIKEFEDYFKHYSKDTPLFIIVPTAMDGVFLGNHIVTTLAFDTNIEENKALILCQGIKIATPKSMQIEQTKLIDIESVNSNGN